MASIQTGIQLNDQFSSVLYDIISAVNMATTQFEDFAQTLNADIDTSAFDGIHESITHATAGLDEMTQNQEDFNHSVQQGANQADQLTKTIRNAIGAYLSFKTVENVINLSDELISTKARLDQMNDGLQTTEELTNMVYAAAQDARGSFSQMADVVARFGNNARDAFSSSQEVVAFADLIQKQMTIAGASTDEASNAMLQLSQALGSGVLRGDELNSIFEQAPNLIQSIADYLDVPIGQIRAMAQEGELTADIVKSAIFASADDINAKFEAMPMTWGQIWQSFQNTALIAFQPVLQRINEIGNSEAFQNFVNNAIEDLAVLAGVVLNIFDVIGAVGQFMADNWSIIEPIVMGVVAALAAYLAIATLVNAINGIMAIINGVTAASEALAAGATFMWTVNQYGLNAALMACPITWIILLIIALIAVIFAVCQAIAKLTGVANTGFGVITGGINVVIQFFKNLGLTVANIALGIASAISALCQNIVTAFSNAIANVQTFFYNLLSTAMSVIAQIANALNMLPFVEIDVSGIQSAATDYANKAQAAQDSKGEYVDVGAAFSEGFGTFDTFQSGWASDAFNAGASWGDGVVDNISSAIDGFKDGLSVDIPDPGDYTSGFDQAIANGIGGSGLGDAANDIAGNTGSIKDSLDVTEEDLKYLRDIAEQEAVNRFTTAEITIEQTNNNTINNDMDLDGVINRLTDGVNEAIESATEGVHD